ncbi:MAG: site-2 protease family protein [Candidatus Aminicenantes bacterium]|nr:site-2 protease family protein [Candidatus Aminicenantes bacterium]
MEEGRRRNKAWLNILLLVVTCLSAFVVGLGWSINYAFSEELASDPQSLPPVQALSDPRIIRLSLVYVAVLIGILLGHEMGHYVACRYYRVQATLPFFIPAPTFVGTLGAFIKIQAPITRKKQLFDIGISGPLVGFVLALPALVYGLARSKVVPILPNEDILVFGEPLLLKFIGGILLRDIPDGSGVFLHPAGFAGWVGVLVTAFNLFPVGQLDGGHVSYALLGPKARPLARISLAVFFFMGVCFWVGWIVWALVILLLGLKHPRVLDEGERLSPLRYVLGLVVVAIFLASFMPAPIKGYSLIELVRQWGF